MGSYIILANPKSGNLDEYEKKFLLSGAKGVLNAELFGLDTTSKEDFIECARKAKKKYDCVVVAGGDGTFSDVLNAGPNDCTLAYLPLGTGNAVGSALGYQMSRFKDLAYIAGYIMNSGEQSKDTILCETSHQSMIGLMTGVGIDADVIQRSQALRESGMNSLNSYVVGSLMSVFGGFRRPTISLEIDDKAGAISDLATLMVTKHPFIGYGLKANPSANLTSGYLHAIAMTSGVPGIAWSLGTAKFGGNRVGTHYLAERINVTCSDPLPIHVEGSFFTSSPEVSFLIQPESVRVRY